MKKNKIKNTFLGGGFLSLALLCGQENLNAMTESSGYGNDKETQLSYAIPKNDWRAMSSIIKDGADVNATRNGTSLLHSAIEKGIIPTLIFITAGANLNIINDFNTALHTAIQHRKINVIKLLIALKMDVNAKNVHGQTPLIRAIADQDAEIEQILCKAGAKKDVLVEEDATILHILAKESDCYLNTPQKKSSADWIEKFVKKGFDPNFRNKFGETPLHWAVNAGQKANADRLRALGAKDDVTQNMHRAVHFRNPKLIARTLEHHPDMINARDENLDTPLHIAARLKSVESLKSLIALGADPNALNRNGTPLHIAAAHGYIPTIDALIAHGAKLDIYNNGHKHYREEYIKAELPIGTPLHVAVAENHVSAVKFLLSKGANPNLQQCESEETPLCYAIEKKNLELVKILLDAGANPNIPDYKAPLLLAIEKHDVPILRALLNTKGIDVNVSSEPALCKAAKYKYHDMVELILATKGANPNSLDGNGHSALRIAVEYAEDGLVTEALVRAGADVNLPTRERKRTPLHTVVSTSQNVDVIKILIKNKADLEAKENWFENTPLHQLMESRPTVPLVQLLLDAGANVNAINDCEMMPLHILMQENPTAPLVQQLLGAGADVNAKCACDRTPLHQLMENNPTVPVVQLLLDAGADVNAKCTCDRTPLHLLMQENPTVPVVQLLLDAGADVNAKCTYDRTPLHLLMENNPTVPVVQLLLDAGANVNAVNDSKMTALHMLMKNNKIIMETDLIVPLVQLLLNSGANANAKNNSEMTPLHLLWEKHAVMLGNNRVAYAAHLLSGGRGVFGNNKQ